MARRVETSYIYQRIPISSTCHIHHRPNDGQRAPPNCRVAPGVNETRGGRPQDQRGTLPVDSSKQEEYTMRGQHQRGENLEIRARGR